MHAHGIRHSVFNASPDKSVDQLQIWIVREQVGLEPSKEQKALPEPDGTARLDLIGARRATASSPPIRTRGSSAR